ncbi:MAG: hypothetical protein U1E35_01840 [Rhodospirillales bacterium]
MVFTLGVVNGAENYVEGRAQLASSIRSAPSPTSPIGFWSYSLGDLAEMTHSRRTFYEDSYAEELISAADQARVRQPHRGRPLLPIRRCRSG